MQSKPRPLADIEKKGIEFRPDGWERFEKAVDAATRTPAQHRTRVKSPASAKPAKRGTERE